MTHREGTWVTATATATGPRAQNEDYAVASCSMLAVADGVGGTFGGAIASKLSCRAVQFALRRPPSDADAAMEAAFVAARRALAEFEDRSPTHHRMATTLSLAISPPNVGWPAPVGIGWVGDSQIAVFRPGNGRLDRIGGDPAHPSGVLESWLSASSPHRPRLGSVVVDIGDVMLLHSDGLAVLDDTEIVDILLGRRTAAKTGPGGAADALVHAALRLGATDNVTVVVAVARHGGRSVRIGRSLPATEESQLRGLRSHEEGRDA